MDQPLTWTMVRRAVLPPHGESWAEYLRWFALFLVPISSSAATWDVALQVIVFAFTLSLISGYIGLRYDARRATKYQKLLEWSYPATSYVILTVGAGILIWIQFPG